MYQEFRKTGNDWDTIAATPSNTPWSGNINSVSSTFHGDYRYAPAATTATAKATWTFNGLAPDTYEVWVSWTASEANANNAPYTILATDKSASGIYSTKSRGEKLVNQKFAADSTSNSVKWQKLGEYRVDELSATFALGTLTLELTNSETDGLVIADGVKLVRKTGLNPSLAKLDLRGNPLSNDAMETHVPSLEAKIDGSSLAGIGGDSGNFLWTATTPISTSANHVPIALQSGIATTVDLGYEFDGLSTYSLPTSDPNAVVTSSVRQQSDGKIIVAGKITNGNDSDLFLARFKSNGTIDRSFGTNVRLNRILVDSMPPQRSCCNRMARLSLRAIRIFNPMDPNKYLRGCKCFGSSPTVLWTLHLRPMAYSPFPCRA